jgi:hypothetical protein
MFAGGRNRRLLDGTTLFPCSFRERGTSVTTVHFASHGSLRRSRYAMAHGCNELDESDDAHRPPQPLSACLPQVFSAGLLQMPRLV